MTTNNQIYRYDIISLLSHAFIYNLRQRHYFKKQNRNTNSRGSSLSMLEIASFLGGFCVLATGDVDQRSEAKIPMTTPNEPDMVPKSTKKGTIRYIYRSRIWPQIRQHPTREFTTIKYQDSRHGFKLANCIFGLGNRV